MAPRAAAAPPTDEKPITAATNEEQTDSAGYAYPTPPELAGRPGLALLMEACTLYGVNPDQTRKPGNKTNPRELMHWEHRPGDPLNGEDEYVQLVTCGGLKLRYPADEDTLDRLRRVFRLYKEQRKADGSTEIIALPMPEDVTLPTVAVTGIPESDDHVYKRGYLREGGASEAQKRAARRHAGLA